MQYGIDIFPYERVIKQSKEDNNNKFQKNLLFKSVFLFLISFFISRVAMLSIAPFGLVFAMAFLSNISTNVSFIVIIGSFLGYCTIISEFNGSVMYILSLGFVFFLWYVNHKKINSKIIIFQLISLIGIFGLYRFFIQCKTIDVSFLFSILEVIFIFPLYYIMNYSIICIKDLNKKRISTNEELISLVLLIALVISGTKGMSIYKISISNLLASIFIILVGYINGPYVGTAVGAILGAIMGITYKDLNIYVTVYSLCGLACGTFKELKKWITAIAYLVTFLIVVIYADRTSSFVLMEAIIGTIIFLSIPNKYYDKLSLVLNNNGRIISKNYKERVKSIFTERMNNFSAVLYDMSESLYSNKDNSKLLMKNKSSILIENLADRVCSNCSLKNICWKREIHFTYSSFEELLQNYENNINVIPQELDKKCLYKNELIKNTEEIVNNYILNKMCEKRLIESKKLLATQINNMANSIEDITEQFKYKVNFDAKKEKDIEIALIKEGIKFTDIICYHDKNNREYIKINMKPCGGKQICVEKVLPIINDITEKNMCIDEEGCQFNKDGTQCSLTFKETPKYYIASCVKRVCKEGEKYNGDSYKICKAGEGEHITIISDGMGSGPEAKEESYLVVDLINKLINSGFNKITAIDTVNSIMTLKYSHEEKFSTVDLSNINEYTGKVEFFKVGAVESFIKRDNNIEIIRSKSLPIGILDKADIEIEERKINNGDIIVMMSDGIIDGNDKNNYREKIVMDLLQNNKDGNIENISEQILNEIIKLDNGKPKDDMTIIVSKVYNIY